MKRKHLFRILGTLVVLGSSIQAQVPSKDAPKLAEATLAVEPVAPLRVQVTGLTAENAKALQSALLALQVDTYACDPCKVEQAKAGTCPKCNGTLQMAKKPVLASVTPAPAEGTLTLTLNPKRHVRMSELEQTLSTSSIVIDRAKQALPGRLLLVVRGGSQEKLAKVEKSLMEAGPFAEVKGNFEATTGEMHFVVRARASPTSPMLMEVSKLLESQQLQLTDIFFGHLRS